MTEARAGTRPPASSGTQAVDRAALLVATVVHADEPLSFGELQDECGLPKSTTSRMLTALERSGLLERDETGSYVAGRLFWLYAIRHDRWQELVRLARPTMAAIGEETGETVHLSIRRGTRVVQVAQVDARFMRGSRDWTVVDVPPHCSALGKVFYAWGELAIATPLARLTEATLSEPDELRRDIRRCVRRGWAATVDELEVGLSGIAVPVHSGRELVAALGISGPTQRLQGRHDELGRALLQHARDLSYLLRGRNRTEGKEGVA
jgi:IclR family transcriptional regulator, acetate operon repressor